MKTKTKNLVQNNSWEALAVPFRAYARQKGLTEKDVLSVAEEGRRVKNPPPK